MVVHPKHINWLNVLAQSCALNRKIKETIKILVLFFSILTFSFFATQSFAQFTYELDKTTRFEKMGVEDGLSTKSTTCIHQDKYGFIWIGTQFGLNLYDGYEVKVFNVDPKNPQALFNSYISSIFEETDGTMWFCTYLGISKYNRTNHTFTNYIPDTLELQNDRNFTQKIVQDGDYLWVDVRGNVLFRFNKKTGKFRSFARDTLNASKGIYGTNSNYIFIDGSGVLWVGSSVVGGNFVLNRFNKETETFTHFLNDSSDPESFNGKWVSSMIEDRDGILWIATDGGGLLEIIDKENGKFKHYLHDQNDQHSLLDNNLSTVLEDSKGNIWTGGKEGFSRLNKNSVQFTNYKIPHYSNDLSRSNYIQDINECDKGELWLTTRDGFFRFDPSTQNLKHYLNDPENPSSLGGDLVRQIIVDRNGQTWVVTWENGVNRINHFSNAFRRIQKKANVSNSLSGKSIGRFLIDSQGNFWVGCYSQGGLSRTKINKQKIYENFEHFVFDADDPGSISANDIWAIHEDKHQLLWFGTINALNSYDYNTDSFTRFQHDPDDSTTISSDVVESIFEDSHGMFWVGTRNGLNIMDRGTGKFIRFLPDDNDTSSISNIDIRVIFEDSYGELWLGGGDYLEKLNRKDTSFLRYFPDTRDKSDLYRTLIFEIEEDDSTNLWLSSHDGGLAKMNRNNMTFSVLTTDHGLPSNGIKGTEIDDNGDIWVSSHNGLSRIGLHDYKLRNYDVADGLIDLEFNDRSTFKDEDGWLYFGSKDGFIVFHPDSIKENKFLPPVYITSLTVAGQQKYFDKPLYEMSAIELQHNENDFSFDFVALNYINSLKNQYAYMLEGYDEDWKYVGNKHAANYTNMSPGKYTFRVKGSNNDGYWNEEGASLVVVIHPPMWKTWWAYSLYLLFIISILYIIFRFYLRRQRLLHQLDLEQVNAEKLAELDIEKNKFFSNISHEFRTPLTLILGPLERLIIGKKDGQEKDQLNLVKRNARRLQTLINQLLSLSIFSGRAFSFIIPDSSFERLNN